jgi:phage tail sheath gpL-like
MPISFDNIPSNWRMPLYWVEVDPSMAGLPIVRQPMLIVGAYIAATQTVTAAAVASGGTGYTVGDTIQVGNDVVLTVDTVTTGAITAASVTDAGSLATAPPDNPVSQVSTSGTGTGATFNLTWTDEVLPAGIIPGIAVPNVPKPVGTQAQADREYGEGSELASMFRAAFANNFAQETWCLPLLPLPGSTRASGDIRIDSMAIEAGMLHVYIGGHHVGIVVGTTDTTANIAANLMQAINDDSSLQVIADVKAAPDDDTVTITCKTPGANGNDIRVDLNYFGKVGGQQLPPGLALTLPPGQHLAGGAGVPDPSDGIGNLGESEFEYIALPDTDSNSLFMWEQEMGFEDQGRWGWMRQLYGHTFAAKRDEYSELIIWGLTRNFGILSVMAVEPQSPTPTWEWTASYTAKAARALTNDPARPLQTLSLNRVLPAPAEFRMNLPELNNLSGTGIATQKAGLDNIVRIMRETTTAQYNLYGQSDDAYELVTTLATLAKLIRNQRHVITTKFPRYKLADDGTRFGVGQKIVTPKIIKAELIAQYRVDEFNGLVENVQAFEEHLIVERDPNDPNRLNTLYPPDLVNQLRVFAVVAQFRLQYSRGQDLEIIR